MTGILKFVLEAWGAIKDESFHKRCQFNIVLPSMHMMEPNIGKILLIHLVILSNSCFFYTADFFYKDMMKKKLFFLLQMQIFFQKQS